MFFETSILSENRGIVGSFWRCTPKSVLQKLTNIARSSSKKEGVGGELVEL